MLASERAPASAGILRRSERANQPAAAPPRATQGESLAPGDLGVVERSLGDAGTTASISCCGSEKSVTSRLSIGPVSTTTSTLSGTLRSSSSNRCLRLIANARIATSIGDRKRTVEQLTGDVQHVDAVDRTGERVRQRHRVDHGAVDEHPAVVADRREQARERGARQERGLERTGGEHHLFAGVEVARHDPQGHLQLGERLRGVALRDQRAQALVVEEMVVAGEQVPGTRQPAAREHLLAPRATPRSRPAAPPRPGSASLAMTEALHAPAEVPTSTSGTMSRSSSALSIPTWQTAWLPPPASTNAVRSARVGRRRSWLIEVLTGRFVPLVPRWILSSLRMSAHLVHGLSGAERPELCCARNQPPRPTPSFRRGGGRPTRE